jgi:hypothetical protein
MFVTAQHQMPTWEVERHIASERCECRPTWKAAWSDELSSVVWIFRHHSLDGLV